MAMTTVIQPIMAKPVTHFSSKTRFNQFAPSSSVPSLRRNAARVRCSVESEPESEGKVPSPAPTKVSPTIFDVLAFSGPAPERINGRLAMIGFVAAIGVELAKGQDVFSQISDGGIPWFLGTSIVLSLASLVPLFKGVSVQSKSEGLMTADAELWNGRFAMLGLVALAFTEYLKGGALV